MVMRKTTTLALTIASLLLLAGIAPRSTALAGSVPPDFMPGDLRRPSHVAEEAVRQAAMPSAGGPIGSPFLVADQSADNMGSEVAYNSQDQEYLVVWRNDPEGEQDLYAQIVSENGTLVGHLFLVAGGAGVNCYYIDVAYISLHNEYLVIWGQSGNTVRGQRVSATGQLLGSPLLIATAEPGGVITFPAIDYASTPDAYLVAYVDQSSPSNSTIGLAACAYGSSFCLSDTVGVATPTIHYEPDVAYNPQANEFLVVWREYLSGKHIYGRRVSLSGGLNPLGSNFQISSVSNNEDSPAVAALPRSPDGQYLVVWDSYDASAQDNIWGQRLAGDGTAEGAVIALARTVDDEVMPAIAANAGMEQYVVTWTHRDSAMVHRNIEAQAVHTTGSYVGAVSEMIPVPPGLVGPTAPENPAIAAGAAGRFLITFDDPVNSVRKIFGTLWGNQMLLPMLTK